MMNILHFILSAPYELGYGQEIWANVNYLENGDSLPGLPDMQSLLP